MLTPFICGAFHPEEDDQLLEATSPCSTPRRSSRRNNQHNKENKNPYSARGLDKFEALLSDLQEKRQKIYTQKGSRDISLVRFAYTSSNDCVPIVVKKDKANKTKTKTNDPGATGDHAARNSATPGTKLPIETSSDVKEVSETKVDDSNKKAKNKRFEWGFMKLENWRRPSYYMPAAIVLILLFLVFFGRSVAILCTSIGWYIVPTLKARSSNSSQKPPTATKKKELGRRLSESKMSINNNRRSPSPPTNWSGNITGLDKSPDRHGHRKSW